MSNCLRVQREKQYDKILNTDYYNYELLDLLRICLSFFVVAIHTMPFSSVSRTMNAFFVNEVCRVAVPIFFLINGYFFFYKETSLLKLKRFLFSLLLSYLSVSCIYMYIYVWHNGGELSQYIILTFREGYGHLWYVHSLIVGIMISFILFRYIHSGKILGLIAVSLYTIGAIANDFVGVAEGMFAFIRLSMVRHTLFMAIPFIVLGGVISRYKLKKNLTFLLLSCILLSLENLLLFKFGISQGYENNFFMLFVACSLFILVMNMKIPAKLESRYNRIGGMSIPMQ